MAIAHDKTSRTITAAEVKEWFGISPKAKLLKSQYSEIATRLTKFSWPNDPPAPSDSPWLPKIIEADLDRWWDFQAATDAAKTLLASMPAMQKHWEGQLWSPATRGGYPAIKTLDKALSAALAYIEWPFGYYERETGRKRPKIWHASALVIARVVLNAMIEAGHRDPGITRNSVVVRVVHNAMIRMRFPHSKMTTPTAIAAHLTRWDKKFGLTPKGIAALTTK